MEALVFENYITANKTQFIAAVRSYSEKLGINPNWLMTVMYKESRISHTAVNSRTNATGLIQFMPETATGLGTTTTALKNMSNVEQILYVYKYYQRFAGKLKSYADLYLATFFPIMIGKPDNTIIQSAKLSAQTVAKANTVIDLNKDGKLTIGEFKEYCLIGLPEDVKKKL